MQPTSAPIRENAVNLSALQLRRRYLIALSLIALLTIVSQVLLQFLIAGQTHDSHIVNIAGRQRMLSQKISKASLYLARAASTDESNRYRNQLSEALAMWQHAHKGLQKGDRALELPGNNSAEISALFTKIEPHYQAITAAAQTLLSPPYAAEAQDNALRLIRQNEPDFLNNMNQIVSRYDQEAKHKVEIVHWLEIGLMALILTVLLLEAIFIFAPAARRIRRDMGQLAESEQDMERLFSASPTAMLLVDTTTFMILRANQKSVELTKFSQNQLLAKSLHNLLDASYDANRVFIDKLRGDKTLNEFEVALLDTHQEAIESLVSAHAIHFAGRAVLVLGFTNVNELKKAQQSLEYYATYDELTGLLNRRTGLMFLEKAMARSWRESSPLAVIYADLDGLKLANDTYGHAEGDRLIRAAANIMTGLIRTSDFAVRLGGDEFLMILPNCTPENAQRVADNLENLLAALKSSEDHRRALYLISCGIAGYASDRHATPEDLIAEADQRMYQIKQSRRDHDTKI